MTETEGVDIKFRSDVEVELVKQSASDSDVIFAARVSTQGERSLSREDFYMSPDKMYGLINFLMRERHGSPFEHSVFTFYIRAPIFVWREHMRHRIASYNEESGRYRQLMPEFYVPDSERNLVQTGKTGAYVFERGTQDQHQAVNEEYVKTCKQAYESYERLLERGIAREVARGVLPVNIYSSAYVTINARSLMNFLSLRKKHESSTFPSYPQREIEMVAEKYERIFQEYMPMTYKSFSSNGRVCP